MVLTPHWPSPLSKDALHGLIGEAVQTIEPHTESDPAAVLLQLLVAVGNVIGRGPHWRAEADRHALNLFVALVGETSKGRKGTSWGHARTLVSACDPQWSAACIQTGLSSGEGLIYAVRDGDETQDDIGADDKRLLVMEPEFASTLRVMSRPGNILSPVIRSSWDSGNLQILTKNSPHRATGAHISIISHITNAELQRELTGTDAGSGFGNRLLWVAVRRSKMLPEGGCIAEADFSNLQAKLGKVLAYAGTLSDHEFRRDGEAKALWHSVYPELSEERHGILGAVTSRAEAQVMRLACIYALLDCSPVIRKEHLEAALAVWTYCEASARYIFGDAIGDPLADELLEKLRAAGPRGLTRTDLSDLLGRNRSANAITTALNILKQSGKAYVRLETTGGRTAQRWLAARPELSSSNSFNSFPKLQAGSLGNGEPGPAYFGT